ncbi:MAG TPA: GNAT family N-acetyltransferase [Fimbriimonadaceae bacterium]|nr:GNAT family N-acetyltransferase [Fimbriimonadaceae bacterium]
MVRPINPARDAEIELVAQRMRATLIEVLGEERGVAMYTPESLSDRVRFHLDPSRCTGEVLLAETDGEVCGHTIVRVQEESGSPVGLFSTIYVDPRHRGKGVATALLERGEEWMRARGMAEFVTYTAPWNETLRHILTARGYDCEPVNDEFVRLRFRPLHPG